MYDKVLIEKSLNLYESGLSCNEVAKKVGISYGTVLYNLKKSGNKIRSYKEAAKRNELNDKAFSILDENSCYWAGFLMADGNIHIRENCSSQISIGLHLKDKNHLVKFKHFLESGNKVHSNIKNQSVGFSVRSDIMAEDLKLFGVVPQKSNNAEVTKLCEYDRHFWRGAFDGDGCISVYASGQLCIGFCGSESLVEQFINFVRINTSHTLKIKRKKGVFECRVSGKKAVSVLDILYKDSSIYLDRKFKLYEELSEKKI